MPRHTMPATPAGRRCLLHRHLCCAAAVRPAGTSPSSPAWDPQHEAPDHWIPPSCCSLAGGRAGLPDHVRPACRLTRALLHNAPCRSRHYDPVFRGKVIEQVGARLGLDQQLWHFASNLTALDAHFFTATELLLQQEGQLVQQAAQALGASGWRYRPRALQKPSAASLNGVVTWGPYTPKQAPAAVPGGAGSASSGSPRPTARSLLAKQQEQRGRGQAAPELQLQAGAAGPLAAAAAGVRQKGPATTAATSEQTVGNGYAQPSLEVLISSCGWVGLRPT